MKNKKKLVKLKALAMKNKKRLITLGVLLLAIFLVILLIVLLNKSNKISDLEKIKIEETSKNTMLFMEDIDNSESDGLDRYIAYALDYSYNLEDKNSLTVKEIKEFVESKFNKELDEEELNDIGITPYLLDRNITHSPDTQTYTLDNSNVNQSMIARIPVVKYELKEIKKEKDKFIVTYDKYLVSNPYEILNYYNDQNESFLEDENYKSRDTSDILNYLTCKGKITSVKEAINENNIEKVGKIDKELQVTYIIKGDKLLVEEIHEKDGE